MMMKSTVAIVIPASVIPASVIPAKAGIHCCRCTYSKWIPAFAGMTEAGMTEAGMTAGFTLIELLVFLVVSSLLMITMILGITTTSRNMPTVHNQWVAMQTARQCMEWYLQQARLNGYSTLTCPSTPSAALCSAPTGFTVSTSIACTTWNSDTTYKTITVTVAGASDAILSTQIGDY